MEGEHLTLRGELRGHGGWVTALATTPKSPDTVLSASRDKTVIVWNLTRGEESYGVPVKSLVGHSHFVEDLAISSDGQFALSCSWDSTLRLWDLSTGRTVRRFVGHTADVLSVAFSADNRQIVSGSRDKRINLWNTRGECKYSIVDDSHTEWVSSVRFSPNTNNPIIVSAGWDKMVKIFDLTSCTLRNDLTRVDPEGNVQPSHNGYVNVVTVSPDGSLCASGGKDTSAMLWDLNEGRHLYTLDGDDIINDLTFSPTRYWLCAATDSCIKIWDLETKTEVDSLSPDFPALGKKGRHPSCLSLAWSSDGATLFAGYSDGIIRVWSVSSIAAQ